MLFAFFVMISLVCRVVRGRLIIPEDLNHVSEFQYPLNNTRRTRVYEVKDTPEDTRPRKRYVHDPVFVPSKCDRSDSNTLLCCNSEPNEKVICELIILLTNPEIRILAFDSLKRNPEECPNVEPTDISLRPVHGIKIGAAEFDRFGFASLISSYIPVVPGQEQFVLRFSLPSIDHVSDFDKFIRNTHIGYTCLVKEFDATYNSYNIKWSDLMQTALYAALEGVAQSTAHEQGETVVFIHRDDMRDLLLLSASSLRQQNWIQNEAHFVDNLEKLLLQAFHPRDTDSTGFTSLMWESTYHSEDLRGDKLTEWARRKYDEEASSSSSEAGGSFKAELGGFSFTDKESQSFQERHEINLQKKGEIYVPRSVKVRRVNLSKFSSDLTLTRVDTFIQPKEFWAQGEIDVRRSMGLTISSFGGSIEQRISEIRNILHSAYLILPWTGEEGTIPRGWKICDGTHGTLDLRERVLRGAHPGAEQADNANTIGKQGGNDFLVLKAGQMPSDLIARHGNFARRDCNFRLKGGGGNEPCLLHEEGGLGYRGKDEPFDNRQAFTSIYFICKVEG